jgi:uncharacterized protein (TIRG00374 family)
VSARAAAIDLGGVARWSVQRLVLFAAVVALFGWTLISWDGVRPAIAAASAIWSRADLVGLFVLTYTAAFALRALAWGILLGPDRPGALRLLAFLQIALLANHVFPTKVGEVVRATLPLRAGVSLARATSTTVVARLLDLVSLCAIALVPLSLPVTGGAAAIAAPATLLVAASLVLVALRSGGIVRLLQKLPARIRTRADEIGSAVREVRGRRIAGALALTAPSWILEAFALWTVAEATGVPLPLVLAVTATAYTVALQTFQFTPGGLGLYEASLTGVLVLHGVDPGVALSLAVATHAIKFAYAYAIGAVALSAEAARDIDRRRMRALRSRVASWLDPAIALWAMLVALLIAYGVGPSEVMVSALASLVIVAVARQWWSSARPLPRGAAVGPGGTVLVIVPVRNEAATIADVVARVPRDDLRRIGLHASVLVIDDGSTDKSAANARVAGADRVLQVGAPRGLGAALRTGLAAARDMDAAAAVYLDGDGEYDAAEITRVLAPVLAGDADYVLGDRFPAAARVMRASRARGNRAFTLLLQLLTGRRITDGQTGFRAFSRRALCVAEIVHDYNYAQVLTLDLLRKRMRLSQVAISYVPRRAGRSFIRYPEYLRRVLPAIARELLAP